MSKVSIGAGNVSITLNGEEVTLRPTLRAAQTISKQAGGIMSAVQAVARFDLEVLTSVIALGLDIKKPAEVNQLAEQVYTTGMADLVEPVTQYLSILANGGRPVAGGEENPR